MPRWLLIAALSTVLLSTSLWAQRGGHGGMGGGGHVGVSSGGGYAAHGSPGYASHAGGGYAHMPGYAGASHSGYWAGGSRGWNGNGWNNGWHGNGWHGSYPYRPWGWGYGSRWGYPWWGVGYGGWGGYPWWGWYGGNGWDNSSYYADNSYDAYPAQTYPSYVYVNPGESGEYSQTQQIQQDEIDRLNNQVEHLQAQGQSQNQAPQRQGKTIEIHAETVLVYRDGHAEEIQNYAIVGKTMWIFDEARARKIPLSDLDLPATKRDNDDRGIDFVLPSTSR